MLTKILESTQRLRTRDSDKMTSFVNGESVKIMAVEKIFQETPGIKLGHCHPNTSQSSTFSMNQTTT
ncbi:hypothetical protein PCANC_15214 [Puccinia coronata f. sp. avenae]|uniref:Uncharacterized protein n=1 Tax=Puccinia coronata f. sp. avenae TaxID=200324 RepID=A0A2N5UFG8_9BASI|nr:hypothetical protein PCANC_15214 [Puccinia coronata f. sp. avenae]